MRNIAAVSMSLLLVLLQLTALYSTAQAGRDGVFRNLGRLIPHKKNNKINQNNIHSNDYCNASDAVASNHLERTICPLDYRGGYKDDVAVQEAEVGVLTDERRLDESAKAKVYGKLEFSFFQKGDGSSEDPDGIPTRYLRMQLHRRELAKKAAKATLDWREEHGIDLILKRPHPDYDVAKAVFPHYFITRDVGGHVVFVQRPALLNLKLAEKNGLNNKALLGAWCRYCRLSDDDSISWQRRLDRSDMISHLFCTAIAQTTTSMSMSIYGKLSKPPTQWRP